MRIGDLFNVLSINIFPFNQALRVPAISHFFAYMNFLVIDAGNTKCKLAIFSKSSIIYTDSASSFSLSALQQLIAAYNPEATIVSSVVHLETDLTEFIGLLPNALMLDEKTSLPVENQYLTPATLGADRLANAIGGIDLFPGRNVLTVDAGTCLKFDFITSDKKYLGGAISPGLYMRFEALHHFTARLPLLTPVADPDLIGNSTQSSIHSGVIHGMGEEIRGIIEKYEAQFSDLQTVLTGGDASYFLNHLKKTIFASPELTLRGLYSILQHNFPSNELLKSTE